MEELGNESDTNITSNKDINDNSSTTTANRENMINENGINAINESGDLLAQQISEYQPEEITLSKKLIIDSITLYNTISTNYGDKKLDINHLAQKQQDKILLETEIFLLNGKKISHIDALDKYINLKELYLNQNYITEMKGLENLKSLEVLNLGFNNISKIENISHLSNLQILDLSNNLIKEFKIEFLPKKNLIYLYMYYNPFFNNVKLLEYRSEIIANFEKIERIDRLDIKDRERLILIDKSNLKYPNRLKSLDFIQKHYDNYNKKTNEIFNIFKQKIDSDVNKVLENKKNKTMKKSDSNMSNISNMSNVSNIDSKMTTTNEIHVDEDDKSVLREIKELKKQSEDVYNDSILSLQNRNKNVIKETLEKKQKSFMQSDSVKKLQEQIDLLNEKFKKANFIDPEIKKKFEQKIMDAIKFKERITHAEDMANKVLDNFKKKEVKAKKKPLESIPEEENKNIEINEKIESKISTNPYINKINEIKLEESDSEKDEEEEDKK
mgnify:CR=1 FL=1